MAQVRIQVNLEHTNGLPRDTIVTGFYLDTDFDPLTMGTDFQGLVDDAAQLWNVSLAGSMPNYIKTIRVKGYAMSDPTPREPRAEAAVPGGASTTSLPRDVCLCLSYFAERNIPRRRGRMYIGPFSENLGPDGRPVAGHLDMLATLAEGISGLGGPNVQWVQHSARDGSYNNVTDYWIDNEWDTQRSRGMRATTRRAGTVNG